MLYMGVRLKKDNWWKYQSLSSPTTHPILVENYSSPARPCGKTKATSLLLSMTAALLSPHLARRHTSYLTLMLSFPSLPLHHVSPLKRWSNGQATSLDQWTTYSNGGRSSRPKSTKEAFISNSNPRKKSVRETSLLCTLRKSWKMVETMQWRPSLNKQPIVKTRGRSVSSRR